MPLCELSLRTRCLYVCMCVRACLPVCVRVRVCAQDMIDATGASQRRPYWIANRVASRLQALVGKVCYYVCVSARWCGHLRPMDFVCGAFVCAFVCASPTPQSRHAHRAAPRYLPPPNNCQRLGPHGAAGEPRKDPCYNALKPSRAPSSWARFSVVFSRSGDLSFPIFTKPTTMDKKWVNRACPI